MVTFDSIRQQLCVMEMMPPSMRDRYLKAIQGAINSLNPEMRQNGRRELWDEKERAEIEAVTRRRFGPDVNLVWPD